MTTLPAKAGHSVAWRLKELVQDDTWPLAVRLDRVNPLTKWRSHDEYLLRTRDRDASGEFFFRLGGRRIYYCADDLPVQDEQKHLQATLTILREAFLFNDLLGDEHVQIGDGDVVLDLGGNIGTSCMHFASHVGPGGRIYSFEPITHSILRRNVSENLLSGIIEVIPKAVADEPGHLTFDTNDSYIDSSLTRCIHHPDAPNRRAMTAPVTTIDAFVDERKLDRLSLVKMDIEGAEELAIRGAMRTIERFRPRWTISSYHRDQYDEPQHPKLVALLRELGYEVREVEQRHIYAWPKP